MPTKKRKQSHWSERILSQCMLEDNIALPAPLKPCSAELRIASHQRLRKRAQMAPCGRAHASQHHLIFTTMASDHTTSNRESKLYPRPKEK